MKIPVKILHRSMLYPFMTVHGEDCDEEGQEVVNPPSKSLNINAALLQEANLKMDSYFVLSKMPT